MLKFVQPLILSCREALIRFLSIASKTQQFDVLTSQSKRINSKLSQKSKHSIQVMNSLDLKQHFCLFFRPDCSWRCLANEHASSPSYTAEDIEKKIYQSLTCTFNLAFHSFFCIQSGFDYFFLHWFQ